MIVYTHNDCLKKFNGHTHPERKERLESILSSIKSSNLEVEFKEAPLADLETVSLVHPKDDIAASASVTEITTGKYRVAPMMSIAEDAKAAKKLKPKWEKYYAKWKKKNQK